MCGSVPHAEASDVAVAVAAAHSAFGVWRKVDAWTRSSLLRRMAAYFFENREEIAWVLTEEQGKPLAEARAEVDAAAEHLDWCADEARRAYGRVIPSNSADVRISLIRQPIGPVAAFTPWNFPVLLPARKIGPALAVGCSIILKPAEEAPRSTLYFARAS